MLARLRAWASAPDRWDARPEFVEAVGIVFVWAAVVILWGFSV